MAFLDNSGDIILDAVLTDTGRYLMAKGDGSFRIAKFALGDDEIDYGLYDKTQSSAYTDVDILSTPILEAFTDNLSGLKSKLISIPRNDLLFLPVIKLYKDDGTEGEATTAGLHCVAADATTEALFADKTGLFGSANPSNFVTNKIVCEQGLDTAQIPPTNLIDSDLKETQYIVEIDSRLVIVLTPGSIEEASVFYIDDDKIASYYLTLSANGNFVASLPADTATTTYDSAIQGPRGSKLSFALKGTLDLQYSTFLFEQLGSVQSLVLNGVTDSFHVIDSSVRVTGATTGYRIDIPVRFIKKS
jgi:hypothetical protein